jgi:hypothetical protein
MNMLLEVTLLYLMLITQLIMFRPDSQLNYHRTENHLMEKLMGIIKVKTPFIKLR